MYLGEYFHSLDKKNRIFIPSRFRKKGRERFVITCGLEGCLFIYPQDAWKRISNQFSSLPLNKKAAREFLRTFLSGATQEEVDRQGRLLISKNLLKFAGINREAVVLGVGERLEIWSRKRWEEYRSKAYKRYAQIAEKLDLGAT